MMLGCSRSVESGSRTADDLRPFSGILLDQLGELLGRAARRLVADLREAVAEALRGNRLVDAGIELVDDRPRHSGRGDDPTPGRRLVAGNAGLRDRGQVGKAR